MHPSAALALWLFAVLATQYLGYAALSLLAVLLLMVAPASWRAWAGYVWRARWLLATLWLILAWNVPGEAVANLSWAPTYEGIAESCLHTARLTSVLGLLAVLFNRLGQEGLVSGLWGLLRLSGGLGVDGERFVVRLALVLEGAGNSEPGSWRKVLRERPQRVEGGVLHVALPAWRAGDGLLLAAGAGLLAGAAWL